MVVKSYIKKKFQYKKITKEFVRHNKMVFEKFKRNSNNKILLEINNMRDSHIIYSYLSNVLAKKFDAQVEGFYPRYFSSIVNLIIFKIKKILNFDYLKVYQSFNVDNFVYPKRNISHAEIIKIKKDILKKIKEKEDIYNISLSNINIGDLIYDAYLRKYNLPTININEKKFHKFLEDIISLFFYWENYFKINNIKATIISHTTYEFGIILRISVKLNIPTYSAAPGFIYSHDKDNLTTFEMRNYSKEFKLFSYEEQKIKYKTSSKILNQKFSGEKTIENKVSLLPPNKLFGEFKNIKRVVENNDKTKCLIAAHHFSDAPNAWGRLLFSDFYDWIDYLGKLSEKVNYDWYIKFHPMDQKENLNTAKYFLKKYKKFRLVDPMVSHEQLISEGINLVLTVYGTIGMEYAYYKIPVINASINNPHISYDFNYHPKTIHEYEQAIINYKNLKINYSKQDISEYFYMRYLNAFYMYPDELTNNEIILTQSPKAYLRWLKLFTPEVHKKLTIKIEKFINSKKFKFIDEEKI